LKDHCALCTIPPRTEPAAAQPCGLRSLVIRDTAHYGYACINVKLEFLTVQPVRKPFSSALCFESYLFVFNYLQESLRSDLSVRSRSQPGRAAMEAFTPGLVLICSWSCSWPAASHSVPLPCSPPSCPRCPFGVHGHDKVTIGENGRSMRTIAAGKFKAACLKIMDDVQATREPLVITKRGRPVAKLVPIPAGGGEWLGSLADVMQIVGDIETPPVPSADWKTL